MRKTQWYCDLRGKKTHLRVARAACALFALLLFVVPPRRRMVTMNNAYTRHNKICTCSLATRLLYHGGIGRYRSGRTVVSQRYLLFMYTRRV